MGKYFTPESVIFAVDMTMQLALKDPDFTVLVTYPPIIAQAPSQSNMFGSNTQDEDVEAAGGIQISARVNAARSLARLGPERWKYEWTDS